MSVVKAISPILKQCLWTAHFLRNRLKPSSSSECSAQGKVFHCELRHQNCNSAKVWSSTAYSVTKVAVLLGLDRCCSFPLLSAPHSLFGIWKDPRGNNVEVRRVDLANWALRTSPKLTTGVKYQFRVFLPDQRSGNPYHPSPVISSTGLKFLHINYKNVDCNLMQGCFDPRFK